MTVAVNGATRLYIIIGDPIAQVRAPAGMTQAFAALGRNAVLVPVHIAPARSQRFVQGGEPRAKPRRHRGDHSAQIRRL